MNKWIDIDRIQSQLTFELAEDEKRVLENMLASSVAFLKRKCSQHLEAKDHKEPVACKSNIYQVDERPVQRILRVSCKSNALFVTCANTRPLITVTDDTVILSHYLNELVETTIDFATYKTIQAVSDKINTVSGWSATITNDKGAFPSDDLEPHGGRPCKSRNLLSFSEDMSYSFRSPGAIVLPFIPSFGQCQVKYKAGYDKCPDDLAQLLARMCQYEFAARETEGIYTSESFNGYSYSLNPSKAFEALGGWAEDIVRLYTVDRIRGANVVA